MHLHIAGGSECSDQASQEIGCCLAHDCGVNFHLFAWLAWFTRLAGRTVAIAAVGAWTLLATLAGLLCALFTTGATLGLPAWGAWLNACANTCLATSTAEETRLGLFHYIELGIVFGDAQLIKCCFLRFFERGTCCLYPFHGILFSGVLFGLWRGGTATTCFAC